MEWIILVRVIYDTGRLHNFGEGKRLEILKKCWILEDFIAWSYLDYLLLYQNKKFSIIYQTIATFSLSSLGFHYFIPLH